MREKKRILTFTLSPPDFLHKKQVALDILDGAPVSPSGAVPNLTVQPCPIAWVQPPPLVAEVGMKRPAAAMAQEPMKLYYFPLMAKGLGPALVAELSGLPWLGPKDLGFTRDDWPKLKESGKCAFGQLPLLETSSIRISQCIAIVNYIGKISGLEGASMEDFAMSQSLLAEGEDLYAAMQKFQPTYTVKLGTLARDGMTLKGDAATNEKFWQEWVPNQMQKLDALLKEEKFTSSGKTVGELYLWSMLHQMKLCRPSLFEKTPQLERFYGRLEKDPKVQKVVSGSSSFGELQQYFVNPE
eukprot:s234_g33.t2